MIKRKLAVIIFMAVLTLFMPACGRAEKEHETGKKDIITDTQAPDHSETRDLEKDNGIKEPAVENTPAASPTGKPKDESKLAFPSESEILQRIDADIDADNINEMILIDTRPDDYARLVIFKNEDCVFNSEQHGIRIDKESLSYFEGDILSIGNNNGNPLPEIYLTVCGMDIDELAIIEDYDTLFYGPMFGYEFVDLDDDGEKELCGCTGWGGQVMFNSAQYSSYRFESGKYTYSEALTKAYYRLLCSRAETGFQNNPSYDNFEYLISLYARLGEREKGQLTIQSFMALHENSEEYYDEELFMNSFEQRLIENGF